MNCFMEFIDRLLNAAGRIFRDPQAGVPFVTQLAYENAIVVFHTTIQSKNRLIFISVQKSDAHTIKVWLWLLPCRVLQVKVMLSQHRGGKEYFTYRGINNFRKDCPKN